MAGFRFAWFGLLMLAITPHCPFAQDILSTALASTPDGYWIDAGTLVTEKSKMSDVAWNCASAPCPGNGPIASSIRGTTGPSSVMNVWSGGVLDTDSSRLLVWGGGHQGYYGNEVYGFSLKSLTWSRLTVPSSIIGWNQIASPDMLPDGSPVACHTYNSLQYLPGKGLAIFSARGCDDRGYGTVNGWLLDLSQQSPDVVGKWKHSLRPTPSTGYGASAVDPSNGHIFQVCMQIGGVDFALYEYDPDADIWTKRSNRGLTVAYTNAAVDPVRRNFVAVGQGKIFVYSLTTGIQTLPVTSGPQTVQNGVSPGFVWYGPWNKFVGWYGGSTLYLLDPETWIWSELPAAGGATPTAPNGNGTYGRFRYDPLHNVFIVVNRWNESVYIYKPGSGSR